MTNITYLRAAAAVTNVDPNCPEQRERATEREKSNVECCARCVRAFGRSHVITFNLTELALRNCALNVHNFCLCCHLTQASSLSDIFIRYGHIPHGFHAKLNRGVSIFFRCPRGAGVPLSRTAMSQQQSYLRPQNIHHYEKRATFY